MTIEQDLIFQTISEMHEDSNYDQLQEVIQQQKDCHIQSIQCRVLQLLFQSQAAIDDYTDTLEDVQDLLKTLSQSDCMPADIEINSRLQDLYYEKAAQFGLLVNREYRKLFWFDGQTLTLKQSDQLHPSIRDLKLWIAVLKDMPIRQVGQDSVQITKSKSDISLQSFMQRQLKPSLYNKLHFDEPVPERDQTLLETVQEVLQSDEGSNIVYTKEQSIEGKKKTGQQVEQRFKITQRTSLVVEMISNAQQKDVRDIVVLWLAHEAKDPVLLYNDTVYMTLAILQLNCNDLIPKMRQKAIQHLTQFVYRSPGSSVEEITEQVKLVKHQLRDLHNSIKSKLLATTIESLVQDVDFSKKDYAVSQLHEECI